MQAAPRHQASMFSNWADFAASRPHHAIMQPRNGIERGENSSLLPCRKRGRMLTRQRDPSVDLAQIAIVRDARLLAPVAAATERKRHPMPCHGNAVFIFGRILRMDHGAELDRACHPLGRRHCGKFIGAGAVEDISAEQHAAPRTIESGVGIGDLADRQVGIANAAIDRLVLLPESALELEADLDRTCIGTASMADFTAALTSTGSWLRIDS